MEQWQEDLKGLIRKPPEGDIKGTVQRIMHSKTDDRSAALACAAFPELGLAAGIATFERTDPTKLSGCFGRTAGNSGPSTGK
jgi:hypothetical protein